MKKHEKSKKPLKPIKHKKHNQNEGQKINFSIIPTVKRYFYIPKVDINLEYGSIIPSNLFTKDNGDETCEFIRYSPNGYINLYINGVMQEGDLYKVNANSLKIKATPSTIFAGTPIIIESLGFSAKILF